MNNNTSGINPTASCTAQVINDCARAPHATRVFLGGSFDPVHIGHSAILWRVYNAIQRLLDPCLLDPKDKDKRSPLLYASFLPTARSPFKATSTASAHRLAMLKLACRGTPFTICDIEVNRPAPTYTIDTLKLLRKRYPNDALIFVLGADSAASLSAWKAGLQLTDYCHLWILPRGQTRLPKTAQLSTAKSVMPFDAAKLPLSLQKKVTPDSADLKNRLCGHIYLDNSDIISLLNRAPLSYVQGASTPYTLYYPPLSVVPPIPMLSSSDIRASIAEHNMDYAKQSLTPAVVDYISKHKLYAPIGVV